MPNFGTSRFDPIEGNGVLIEWAPHRDEPQRVANDLNQAASALENMHKLMIAAREVVVGDVKMHFAEATGPDGPWDDLAGSSYEKRKFARREESFVGDAMPTGGPSNLTQTGAGRGVATDRSSYTIESDSEGGSITFTADPPDFMLEHNRGAEGRYIASSGVANPLPKREWLWLSGGAEQGIYQLFEDFVDDAVAIVMNPLTGGAEIRTSGGFFQSPTAFYG